MLEEAYNLEDALLVGGFLNSLMRKSDRVRAACLAQLVNVIAPITTNPEGYFRQTIYYPYLWALQYASGRVLDLAVESATYDVRGRSAVPYLDVAGTMDEAAGTMSVFLLNRDLDKTRNVEIIWRDTTPKKVRFSQVLTGRDLKASNSFKNPNNVAPKSFDPPQIKDRTSLELPARSYTVLQLEL
jgi:alpha-N-arabinofuranosidase